MNIVWIIVGLSLAVASIFLMFWRRTQVEDLGSVSHQWIAEHRLGSSQDSRR